MNETNILAAIIVGFFVGIIFTLAGVCLIQFFGGDLESFPVQQVRTVISL